MLKTLYCNHVNMFFFSSTIFTSTRSAFDFEWNDPMNWLKIDEIWVRIIENHVNVLTRQYDRSFRYQRGLVTAIATEVPRY